MSPRLHFPRISLSHLARNIGFGVASIAPWLPAYVLFLDNVASIEKVSGLSMSPNFCPDPTKKDWIIAQHWKATENLQRGQVVLYRSPVDPERQVIKRIVGLEGDIVRTRHPYPKELVVVPRGQVWVEGDEAFHSVDSNTYGPVPIALITSKVTHIVYPFARAHEVSQEEGLSRKGALYRRAVPKELIQAFGM